MLGSPSDMRRFVLALGVSALVFGPWSALPAGTSVITPADLWAQTGGARSGSATGGQVTGIAPQIVSGGRTATGCTCREVVVNASNVVRNADVRTGDSKTINRSITYISPSFEGDDEVEVEQEAVARTGDAVAGQILGINAGEGCARVHVNATNIVEEADVRSGDAIAKNKSLILLDPRITKKGDIEIEVDQEAEAKSGDAVAGQIIGIQGGGGPCGGVILNALNRVREVDVRSGDAITDNLSQVLNCDSIGCVDDINRMLKFVDTVQVCSGETCRAVPVKEFKKFLKNPETEPDWAASAEDEDADNEDESDEDEAPTPERKEELRSELEALKADMRTDHPRETATDSAVEEDAG